MTTQNFPKCSDPLRTMFAWALSADTEDVVEAIEYTETNTESGIQLQALLAMAEA